ncbi:hypothetical protein [Geodermatophilus ruber]|uniref:Uncharacterized protein n=1 Tax=Geodermatophilus ruber TaxID=504800 RepID=A0A1I4A3Z7_9ACTN|nr:hypothetical protein [Geodermatophilus ruber]SFK50827.1 hypothetical protein SAMN04488085_10257 [Geodermatophilus ruber]
MAHATRGHRSGTYEIQELLAVDPDALTITYRHAGAYQPQTARLTADSTPAARQLLQAMADSIKVADNGDSDSGWESAKSVINACWYGKIMLAELAALGFDDFADARIDVPVLRALYQPMSSGMRRSACLLLARVVRANHPNGPAVAAALKNTRFSVEDTNPFTYDEAVSDAIEASARGVYLARYTAQRELFQRLGYAVDGRSWLRIPAEEVIDWARTTHPDVCQPDAPQPRVGDTYERQVAWALTHPGMFGYVKHQRRHDRPIRGQWMADLGDALYPDNVTLTAALVLHCLGENSGYNHSVLLEKSVDSLVYLGSQHALERSAKSRNQTQDTRPTRLSSIFTPGGVIETLTGLTRFARHHRRTLLDTDGNHAPVVRRLYVEHCADPTQAKVLDLQRQQSAWRSNPQWDEHWDEATAGPRESVSLRMAALRMVAQARALNEGLHADVHGHSERTKVHYAAHVLPQHVLNKHAVAAQNAFHDDAVASFTVVADATDGPAAELAAVDPDQVMDVEIGVCTSGGNDPESPTQRCALGIVACFTCPNGYRTVDHIPGLLGAVELGDIIERNDPTEWEFGEASRLRFYAQQCLQQFPRMVVENVRRTTDLRPHILTVTGMYMEMRHG